MKNQKWRDYFFMAALTVIVLSGGTGCNDKDKSESDDVSSDSTDSTVSSDTTLDTNSAQGTDSTMETDTVQSTDSTMGTDSVQGTDSAQGTDSGSDTETTMGTDSGVDTQIVDTASAADSDSETDSGVDTGVSGDTDVDMGTDVSIILLHHSTGGNVWNGGVSQWFETYNEANGTGYQITQMDFPHDPYPWANYPYDYWHLWVENDGPTPVDGQETLEILTAQYDVIVFKHCFPVSEINDDVDSPSVTSEEKTIGNYKLQYAALKEKLRSFPNNRFVVWTGAANVAGAANEDQATRARTFFSWVKNEWDEPGDNIYIWDFFALETEGGIYILDEYAASEGDSHPNEEFCQRVAPMFANRVVNVLTGNGDATSITGE